MDYNIKILFVLCVAIRLLLAYIVYLSINESWRFVLVVFYAIISLGSFAQMFIKFRSKGAFGQKIWWGNYRPIHGLLWGMTAYYLYNKNDLAYSILLLDTSIGILAHVYHRYM